MKELTDAGDGKGVLDDMKIGEIRICNFISGIWSITKVSEESFIAKYYEVSIDIS